MIYLIFAFRSRSQSMRFYNELKNRRVDCSLINTPREVSLGCGLSVRTDESAYGLAVALLNSLRLNTFLGAFRLSGTGQSRRVERLFL